MSYQCVVPGCPGTHESKWQVCAALDAGRVNAPSGTTSKPVATEPQDSAGESPAPIPLTSNDRIQALRTRFNNPEKQWSRAHTESLFNEIERLTRESEAWDKASLVAIIAERDRLTVERDQLLTAIGEHVTVRSDQYAEIQRQRAALEKIAEFDCRPDEHVGDMKCWSCYANEALSGEPNSAHETSGKPEFISTKRMLAEIIADLEAVATNSPMSAGTRTKLRGLIAESAQLLSAAANRASEKASARPSEGPGSILGCACIMCEYHRSAEDIERKRRAEAGESPCGG